MITFSQIATFLQNQFNQKPFCDLISQPIFKLYHQIKSYFKAIPIVYDMYIFYLSLH